MHWFNFMVIFSQLHHHQQHGSSMEEAKQKDRENLEFSSDRTRRT